MKAFWTDDYTVYKELEDVREVRFITNYGNIDIKLPRGGQHAGKLIISGDGILTVFPRAANQIIVTEGDH